jgi:hypothetical protein
VGDEVGHALIHQVAKESQPHEYSVGVVLKTLNCAIRNGTTDRNGPKSNLDGIMGLEECEADKKVACADQKKLAVLYRHGATQSQVELLPTCQRYH